MRTLVLTGGGTAGHVIPCIAVAEKLPDWNIHYIGRSTGIERELCENRGITYHAVDCPRFVRNKPWTLFPIPFKLMRAKRQARKILEEIKPDAIFSKGGYVSLPTVLAAKNIPVVLHESDRSFGLANKLVLKKCRAVCTSFPMNKIDVICTGSPLTNAVFSGNERLARQICNFEGIKPVLLVTGGSLGARALNNAVQSELDALLKEFDIIHLTGRGYNFEKRNGYCPIDFTDKIYALMNISDFAVTRGGGNTIFELAALGIPSLIVPLPKGASRGDQIDNAQYFESNSWALTASESDIIKNGLMPHLALLRKNADKIKSTLSNRKFDGSHKIAKLIRDISRNS